MEFNKSFYLRINPNYSIGVLSEQMSIEELIERKRFANKINGDPFDEEEIRRNYEEAGSTTKYMGGRFDWELIDLGKYKDEGENPLIDVQLMRLWALQLTAQLVRDKGYVNEADSKPKFDLSDEEVDLVDSVMKKMLDKMGVELEKTQNEMVAKRKPVFSQFSMFGNNNEEE
jgi:hypothetical protein